MRNVPVLKTAQFIDEERPVQLLPGKKQGTVGVDFGRYAPSSSRKPRIDQDGKVQTVKQHTNDDEKRKQTQGKDDPFFY